MAGTAPHHTLRSYPQKVTAFGAIAPPLCFGEPHYLGISSWPLSGAADDKSPEKH